MFFKATLNLCLLVEQLTPSTCLSARQQSVCAKSSIHRERNKKQDIAANAPLFSVAYVACFSRVELVTSSFS